MSRRQVIVLVSITIAAVVIAGVALTAVGSAQFRDGDGGTSAASVTVPVAAPAPQLAADPGPGFTGTVDRAWAKQMAQATGIPELAVVAYAAGALGAEYYFPGCGISWSTLAAIGLVESDHGRHGGGVIDEAGHIEPLIFGVALDGDGVALIPDTDGGAYDLDPEHDRAVGPMQFIPRTWQSWAVDANGDEIPDPHNIHDAALAAGDYLCFRSGGMSTDEGWLFGIAAYNAGEVYLRDIAVAAQRYTDAAASVSP